MLSQRQGSLYIHVAIVSTARCVDSNVLLLLVIRYLSIDLAESHLDIKNRDHNCYEAVWTKKRNLHN